MKKLTAANIFLAASEMSQITRHEFVRRLDVVYDPSVGEVHALWAAGPVGAMAEDHTILICSTDRPLSVEEVRAQAEDFNEGPLRI